MGCPLTTWVSLEALATASPRSEKYLPEARGVTTGMDVQREVLPQTLPIAPLHPIGMPSFGSPKEMSLQTPVLAFQLSLLGNGCLEGFHFGLDCIYPLQHLFLWRQKSGKQRQPFVSSLLHSPSPSSSEFLSSSYPLLPKSLPAVSIFTHPFSPGLPPQSHFHPQFWG